MLQEERMQGGCCRVVDARGKDARMILQNGGGKRKGCKVDVAECGCKRKGWKVDFAE
jgi:hypothetical protein